MLYQTGILGMFSLTKLPLKDFITQRKELNTSCQKTLFFGITHSDMNASPKSSNLLTICTPLIASKIYSHDFLP